MSSDAITLVERVRDALNRHDLDALVDCFSDGYVSEQPAHPGRAFTGNEQVRANWRQMFGGLPDLKAELVRSAVDGDTIWAEWSWRGTPADGVPMTIVGVTIFGIADGRIAWGRLYMEPVERGSAEVGTAIERDLLNREPD